MVDQPLLVCNVERWRGEFQFSLTKTRGACTPSTIYRREWVSLRLNSSATEACSSVWSLCAMPAPIKRHSCFVCGSLKGKENVKIGIFIVTEDRLSIWKKIIKKPGLKVVSKLCDVHFDKADVEKEKFIFDTYYPMKNWKLRDGAKPKFFLGE